MLWGAMGQHLQQDPKDGIVLLQVISWTKRVSGQGTLMSSRRPSKTLTPLLLLPDSSRRTAWYRAQLQAYRHGDAIILQCTLLLLAPHLFMIDHDLQS